MACAWWTTSSGATSTIEQLTSLRAPTARAAPDGAKPNACVPRVPPHRPERLRRSATFLAVNASTHQLGCTAQDSIGKLPPELNPYQCPIPVPHSGTWGAR
jgi:hypothetical protein